MSDGNVNIGFSADETNLVKAQAKLIKQQEEMIQKYKKMGDEAKKANKDAEKHTAAAAKELERFAATTKLINRTPLEKYADEMRRLNQALKAGKIDQETFNRAAASAKTAFQQAGEAGKKAFGPPALSNLMAYVTGLVSVAGTLGLVTRAFREHYAELDRLGEKQAEEAPAYGSLAQLGDTPQQTAQLVKEAQRTFLEGGARTIPEAVEMQKMLESGNIGQWRAEMSRMQASGLANARVMAEGAIRIAAGMGVAEVGSFGEIMSKAFGGAKLGLGEAHELLISTANVSQQAGRLGLSDEETLAAISTASAVAGPSEAATQMQALMKGIEVEGIGGGFLERGKTLREYVDRLQELEAGGADIREMLGGRQEAIMGYGVLSSAEGRSSMDTNLANIGQAVREDWFGGKVAAAEGISANTAAITRRRAMARQELAFERDATVENIADAIAADLVSDMRAKQGPVAGTLQRGQNFLDRLWGNETFIREYGAQASPETQQAAASLGLAMDELRGKFQWLGDAIPDQLPNLTNAARANAAAVGGAVEAR